MRWKLTIEYDGTPFAGWQIQPGGIATVQGALEDAIFGFCGQRIGTIVAGRTDAGVHALAQVAHFDLERDMPAGTAAEALADKIQGALNAHLRPRPIAITKVENVRDDFNARFDAERRHYLYRIVSRRAPPVLKQNRVWHVHTPLNVEAMQQAAQYLLGHHDFTSFRDSECQANSPMRTLDYLDISRANNADDEIHITTNAKSFLHHQVRNMVGSLVEVGRGKWQPEDIKTALEAKDRSAAGPTAPASGLYFVKVDYPA